MVSPWQKTTQEDNTRWKTCRQRGVQKQPIRHPRGWNNRCAVLHPAVGNPRRGERKVSHSYRSLSGTSLSHDTTHSNNSEAVADAEVRFQLIKKKMPKSDFRDQSPVTYYKAATRNRETRVVLASAPRPPALGRIRTRPPCQPCTLHPSPTAALERVTPYRFRTPAFARHYSRGTL